MQPSLPEWDQVRTAVLWWEEVGPCAPHRIILEAATSGPGLEEASDSDIVVSLSPQGETGTGERGWTPMKRIFMALSALAALFLVVGAGSSWH